MATCALPGCPEKVPQDSACCCADHTQRFYAGEKINIPDAERYVSTSALCTEMGISESSLKNWIRQGLVSPAEYDDGRAKWNAERVRKEMASAGLPKRVFTRRTPPPLTFTVRPENVRPVEPADQSLAIVTKSIDAESRKSDSVRAEAIRAAKEAARDVFLRHADLAKKRGDHAARADYLDDFVHLEEGLKLTFEPRRA